MHDVSANGGRFPFGGTANGAVRFDQLVDATVDLNAEKTLQLSTNSWSVRGGIGACSLWEEVLNKRRIWAKYVVL